MLETRLIRNVRARQEAEAAEALAEVVAGMLPELLLEAFKFPQVRTAICNIVAADRRSSQPPASPRRATPTIRGGRRGI